jgi:hypothetical protein
MGGVACMPALARRRVNAMAIGGMVNETKVAKAQRRMIRTLLREARNLLRGDT